MAFHERTYLRRDGGGWAVGRSLGSSAARFFFFHSFVPRLHLAFPAFSPTIFFLVPVPTRLPPRRRFWSFGTQAMDSLSYRLVHSLTAHLALYHSSSSSPSPNSTLRASLLRWFSSLSPGHRQAALTVCDAPFVLVLLQMQSHLRRFGHSHFLLLPDLPSSSGSSLPSLSFRTSRGLLSRLAASNSSAFLFYSSILLFSSSGACPVDALTVSESLVADVDRFVVVMDKLSGGRFLCEEMEVIGLTAFWAELPWLKDMGYYSLEAFVANRLEVALRLAWFSSQGGKKPKEKRAKEKASQVAGKAANVFWRTKGRCDGGVGLDPGRRRAIISTIFGKAAKALVLILDPALT